VEASAHDQVLYIPDIVDAAIQLPPLAEIVDAYEKSLLPTGAVAD